jgi:hypothetical protein
MTVSISHMTSFCETLVEWWSPTTLTSRWPIPWATPKGFSPPSQDGRSLMRNRLLHGEVGLPEGPPQPTPAAFLYDAPPSLPSLSKTFLMHMQNGKPKLGSSWTSLSKLVSRRESHTSTCGRMLSLGLRDKNLGPRAARMSQITTSHVVAHPSL